jgi:hypothetical protein
VDRRLAEGVSALVILLISAAIGVVLVQMLRGFTPSLLPASSVTGTVTAANPTETLAGVITGPGVGALPGAATAAAPSATSTVAPTLVPTIAPTIMHAKGPLIVLWWVNGTFYASNQGNANILLASATFQRVLKNGAFSETFSGARWSSSGPGLQVNKCAILRTVPVSDIPDSQCPQGVLANIVARSGEVFWTPTANATDFRVLWGNQEIVRCKIALHRCVFFVPTSYTSPVTSGRAG